MSFLVDDQDDDILKLMISNQLVIALFSVIDVIDTKAFMPAMGVTVVHQGDLVTDIVGL